MIPEQIKNFKQKALIGSHNIESLHYDKIFNLLQLTSNIASKYRKEKYTYLQWWVSKSTVIVRDFNIPIFVIDNSNIKIGKDKTDLDCIINTLILKVYVGGYIMRHYTLFSGTQMKLTMC